MRDTEDTEAGLWGWLRRKGEIWTMAAVRLERQADTIIDLASGGKANQAQEVMEAERPVAVLLDTSEGSPACGASQAAARLIANS